MAHAEIITLKGPVGALETQYIAAKGQALGVAVINHPNPLYGGTFSNKVVQIAAKALSELGFHCYLPNLRGVGNSEGVHDKGVGEVEDCLQVVQVVKLRHPEVQHFVLAGFSFGGYVSLFAAKVCRPDALILLGAALQMYERVEPLAVDPKKTLVIHGENDDVVPLSNALSWAKQQGIPVWVVPESTHFFHGKLMTLHRQIKWLIPPLLQEAATLDD